MKQSQAGLKEYRTWTNDSRRWSHYQPRQDDVVIATYPKCGTTWMQRIVASLIFKSAEPLPITELSPWVERRFLLPIDQLKSTLEEQKHLRFLKSHMPFDGLPVFDNVKYIHVARDGRDAAFSWHNHVTNMRPEVIKVIDEIAMTDELLGRPFPAPHENPADEFHRWLTEAVVPSHTDGLPHTSYFYFEKSWWDARHSDNVLLVHFNDLKSDLAGEFRRIADILQESVPESLMQDLVEAATFSAMHRDAASLAPSFAKIFDGGAKQFLNRGTNRRWVGVFRDKDLKLYDEKAKASLSAECILWLEHGGKTALL